MNVLEFRSDTFTQPTPAMRHAMAEAEVGDDLYGEDPTVNRLEERAAAAVGKEAAVYVPSGIMGNLCGILSQAERGEEVVFGDRAHIYQNEMGAFAVLGALHGRTVPNRDGLPALDDLAAAIRPPAGAFPRTALVCLENSHNNCGGTVLTAAETRAVADLAHARRPGPPRRRADLQRRGRFGWTRTLCAPVDTVPCRSPKGPSAPVGSVLCGPKDTVARARRVRKTLGGAMRQSGVVAAAALVALETMRERLAEDHANAKALALGLASIAGVRIDPARVVTNILGFELDPRAMDAGAFQRACAERGLRLSRYLGDSPRLRMVTHRGVTAEDVAAALAIASKVLAGARRSTAAAG